MTEPLATVYLCLAEALAADSSWPDWISGSGRQWPLWEPLTALASSGQWPALGRAVAVLAEVPAASGSRRRADWEAVFRGDGRSPPALYESQVADGRLLGPTTFALKAIYEQAGMEVEGAELADHASVELAFLSFLVVRQGEDAGKRSQWRAARRLFVKNHVSRWLPQLGSQLACSADAAMSAIGLLLELLFSPGRARPAQGSGGSGLPAVAESELCSLCGFCVQVCPVGSLKIEENDSWTRLTLRMEKCVRCGECARACEAQVLALSGKEDSASPSILRQSSRAHCPGCGEPTVSEAELAAVAERLGKRPAWLDRCHRCRSAVRSPL